MDNEKLLEELKSHNHKLENDLKVKSETEKHLIYENEVLFSENEKLVEMNNKDKNLICKLQSKIENLEGTLTEMAFLKNLNQTLNEDKEQLKLSLEKQIKINADLKKASTIKFESPTEKFRKIEYNYKCQIQELHEENRVLDEKINALKNQIREMDSNTKQEIDIYLSKVASYKELLDTEKQEREEIEMEFMNFQTEVNSPDFNRQGNNMYVEVDDRRVLAEKRVIEYQDELVRLRHTNEDLRVYLEKAFDTFSKMKEEELREIRRNLASTNKHLNEQNELLKKENNELNKFMEKELSKDDVSKYDRVLRIKLKQTEARCAILEKQMIDIGNSADKIKKNSFDSFEERERMTKEISSLRTQLDKVEARLYWVERIIPKDKLEQHEAEQKKKEEAQKSMKTIQNNTNDCIPLSIFGAYCIDAKYSDKLVFDPLGRPVQNKLTRRIFEEHSGKSAVEEMKLFNEKRMEENPKEMKMTKLSIEDVFKDIAPRKPVQSGGSIDITNTVEQLPKPNIKLDSEERRESEIIIQIPNKENANPLFVNPKRQYLKKKFHVEEDSNDFTDVSDCKTS